MAKIGEPRRQVNPCFVECRVKATQLRPDKRSKKVLKHESDGFAIVERTHREARQKQQEKRWFRCRRENNGQNFYQTQ